MYKETEGGREGAMQDEVTEVKGPGKENGFYYKCNGRVLSKPHCLLCVLF